MLRASLLNLLTKSRNAESMIHLGLSNSTCTLHPDDPSCSVTTMPKDQLLAMAIALFGVLGASVAYTFIRKIGNQAHSLIIVNYLADMATIFSFIMLLLGKGVHLPASLSQAFCLLALGICGFTSQFFLTLGVQEDKTSAATLMIYTQLLFAMGFDWLIWQTVPGWSEWLGCCVIFGSAAVVAVKKSKADTLTGRGSRYADGGEEQYLMVDMPADNSEEDVHTTRRISISRRADTD